MFWDVRMDLTKTFYSRPSSFSNYSIYEKRGNQRGGAGELKRIVGFFLNNIKELERERLKYNNKQKK